jgi:hypothetical protein
MVPRTRLKLSNYAKQFPLRANGYRHSHRRNRGGDELLWLLAVITLSSI